MAAQVMATRWKRRVALILFAEIVACSDADQGPKVVGSRTNPPPDVPEVKDAARGDVRAGLGTSLLRVNAVVDGIYDLEVAQAIEATMLRVVVLRVEDPESMRGRRIVLRHTWMFPKGVGANQAHLGRRVSIDVPETNTNPIELPLRSVSNLPEFLRKM